MNDTAAQRSHMGTWQPTNPRYYLYLLDTRGNEIEKQTLQPQSTDVHQEYEKVAGFYHAGYFKPEIGEVALYCGDELVRSTAWDNDSNA